MAQKYTHLSPKMANRTNTNTLLVSQLPRITTDSTVLVYMPSIMCFLQIQIESCGGNWWNTLLKAKVFKGPGYTRCKESNSLCSGVKEWAGSAKLCSVIIQSKWYGNKSSKLALRVREWKNFYICVCVCVGGGEGGKGGGREGGRVFVGVCCSHPWKLLYQCRTASRGQIGEAV